MPTLKTVAEESKRLSRKRYNPVPFTEDFRVGDPVLIRPAEVRVVNTYVGKCVQWTRNQTKSVSASGECLYRFFELGRADKPLATDEQICAFVSTWGPLHIKDAADVSSSSIADYLRQSSESPGIYDAEYWEGEETSLYQDYSRQFRAALSIAFDIRQAEAAGINGAAPAVLPKLRDWRCLVSPQEPSTFNWADGQEPSLYAQKLILSRYLSGWLSKTRTRPLIAWIAEKPVLGLTSSSGLEPLDVVLNQNNERLTKQRAVQTYTDALSEVNKFTGSLLAQRKQLPPFNGYYGFNLFSTLVLQLIATISASHLVHCAKCGQIKINDRKPRIDKDRPLCLDCRRLNAREINASSQRKARAGG